MGYYSTISGEITIHPPLRWSEVKDTPFTANAAKEKDRALRINVVEEIRPTEDGESITRRGVCIEDNIGESAKYYNLFDELAEIARAYPDRSFDGEIVRVGEENGDVERYWINNGEVRTEKARLVWSDGSEVQTHQY